MIEIVDLYKGLFHMYMWLWRGETLYDVGHCRD